MKAKHIILLSLFIGINFSLVAQNFIKIGSPLIGEWELISPKNSPGPEFAVETYVGVGTFQIASGENISVAAASYDKDAYKKNGEYKCTNAAEFIAEWDEKYLTGAVSASNWPKVTSPLQIKVPLVYDAKKDRIIIHINNMEYGDVEFIYTRLKKGK